MADEVNKIEMNRWGKDHWSTLAYIETRCVDHKGIPDRCHMRCDDRLHPQFVHCEGRYPTRLAGGLTIEPHDDWACLDDAEAEGLVENIGSGINRMYRLTGYGMIVCNALRNHKAEGGGFGDFTFEPLEVA